MPPRPRPGAKAVVLADGTIRGFLGGGCVAGALQRTAAAALGSGDPRLIRIKPKDRVVEQLDVDGTELHKSACPSGGTVDIFVEPMRPAPRLVVCGAAPVAVALADLGRRLGYRVLACALPGDLEAFAADVQRHDGFDLTGLGIAPRDFIVVATQGRRDREALAAALATEAGYVGFVGSRRKVTALRIQLADHGIADDRLARLHGPAGIAIQAIEPAEIALSILAEVVAERRRGIKAEGRADAVPESSDGRAAGRG